MNAHNNTPNYYAKAVTALVAGLTVLSIYIMGCISSPVAWSPDSSKIALLVTPPGNDIDLFGIYTFDLKTGERVLLDKVAGEHNVLSTPAWSPDGKWIAYYKVNRPLPKEDTADPNEAGVIADANDTSLDRQGQEDEVLKVQLMIAGPDGSEQDVLYVTDWPNDDSDVLINIMLSRPVWSQDCETVFFVRGLSDEQEYEICSLDMTHRQVRSHGKSSINIPTVSPDGNWVVSFNKDQEIVILTDISNETEMQVEIALEDSEELMPYTGVLWSPDSKNIIMKAEKNSFRVIDFVGGYELEYEDSDANEIICSTYCLDDNKLYYLAVYKTDDPNYPDGMIDLKRMNLADGQTESVFDLYDLPELEDGFSFSISPNGKKVLLRGMVKDEGGDNKSAFIVWDGQNRKVVETDCWLIEPMYKYEDLILDDKITGRWIGDDGVLLDFLPMEEEIAYDVVVVENEEKEEQYFAHLVELEGVMFLVMFHDKSLLEQTDPRGFRFAPEVFFRVGAIEPKLLLQEADYEEVFEMLKNGQALSGQQFASGDYTFEAVRLD